MEESEALEDNASPSPSNTPSIHPELEVPLAAQTKLLPVSNLSVLDFLKFPLPILSQTSNTHPTSAYFSSNAPNLLDKNTIRKIPVPSIDTVRDLGREYRNPEFRAHSVLCAHIPTNEYYLPLWVITFWLELRSKWLDPWICAEAALRKRKSKWVGQADPSITHALVGEVFALLSTLPWSGNIRGFDNAEPLYCLATYVTRDWFSDVHQNQMLDILRRTLVLEPQSSGKLRFY
jgi:hypothetical protein